MTGLVTHFVLAPIDREVMKEILKHGVLTYVDRLEYIAKTSGAEGSLNRLVRAEVVLDNPTKGGFLLNPERVVLSVK